MLPVTAVVVASGDGPTNIISLASPSSAPPGLRVCLPLVTVRAMTRTKRTRTATTPTAPTMIRTSSAGRQTWPTGTVAASETPPVTRLATTAPWATCWP